MNEYLTTSEKFSFAILIVALLASFYHILFTYDTHTFIVDNTRVIKESRGYKYIFYDHKLKRRVTIRTPRLLNNGTILEVETSLIRATNWKIVGYISE